MHAIFVACMLCLAMPVSAIADVTVPPGPHLRRDAIVTVATVHAVALVASAHCPDILVRTDADDLQEALGITDAEKRAIFDEEVIFVKAYNQQVDTAGAKAWCDDVYGRFGPEGTMMRGLLKR